MEALMQPVGNSPILIDQVYQRLMDAIADYTLPPGQRIRQDEVAERLGVSRQPVSHALHLLKRQGLVRESGRKGLEVAPVDPLRIRQLYEVRGALDGAAARLAAQRIDHDRAARPALEAALGAGQETGAAAPLSLLVQLDTAFHLALYRLSGNPAFEEIIGPHWPQLRRSMATVLSEADYRQRAWAEHVTIAERVLAADAEGAEMAAREHALSAGRAVQSCMGGEAVAA
jgi:DNA-binding GntR family transcriptional regulator